MFTEDFTALMRGFKIRITGEQLSSFVSRLRVPSDIKARISKLFWLDLYVYNLVFHIDPKDVLSEIRDLESGKSDTETKPASKFSHEPIKGLWHKHFFCPRFVPHNIYNVFKGGGFEKIVEEMLAKESPIITEEMIFEFIDKLTCESLEDRAKNNRLTGEWIIFAKHDAKNYYLCLNTHETCNQEIFERVKKYCLKDFPFLSDL